MAHASENAPERRPAASSEVSGAASLLYRHPPADIALPETPKPDCFADLGLNQIVRRIVTNREEYGLEARYFQPLHNPADIQFRQAIVLDLDEPLLGHAVRQFAAAMQACRARLNEINRVTNPWQKRRHFLEAAAGYCEAVAKLARNLSEAQPQSYGLCRFNQRLNDYLASDPFLALRTECAALRKALSTVRYSVLIDGLRVRIRKNAETQDYGNDIQATFKPFRQGHAHHHQFDPEETSEMNRVEAEIMDRVARLWPGIFSRLKEFAGAHNDFTASLVTSFDREIQFYLSYLDYIAPLRTSGLPFCYPHVPGDSKAVFSHGAFDLALATHLSENGAAPVCNDFNLSSRERIMVVTGPNQSGKTTFARMFAQIHYLASLGLPVPGREARLFLPDQILTHFEHGEAVDKGRGKLQDDLIRIHDLLERATPATIVILNEVFSSTTARDASRLSHRIIKKIETLDLLCVWVTFLEELAQGADTIVSMTGNVDHSEPLKRTYRIQRGPPLGMAYALSLAESYGLTAARLRAELDS